MTLKGQGRDPTVVLISRLWYKLQQWCKYRVPQNVFLFLLESSKYDLDICGVIKKWTITFDVILPETETKVWVWLLISNYY